MCVFIITIVVVVVVAVVVVDAVVVVEINRFQDALIPGRAPPCVSRGRRIFGVQVDWFHHSKE